MKTKNRSLFLRSMVLVVAFALAIVFFPVGQFLALAASMEHYVDYSYMTIGNNVQEVETTVTRGAEYKITNAFVGGNKEYVVGRLEAEDTVTDSLSTATIVSSDVKVSYNSYEYEETTSDADGEDLTNKVVAYVESDDEYGNYYGYFVADRLGTYTITYSYQYTVDSSDKVYSNTYEMKVESQVASASIAFRENEEIFIPSIIDLNLVEKTEGKYQNLDLPRVDVTDEDGELIDDTKITYGTTKTESGKCIVVSATSGSSGRTVTISSGDNGLYIDGSVFADPNFGAGEYTIRYSYYEEGNFISSVTKTTTVYAENTADRTNGYYENYALARPELSTEWSDNGQTGIESTLPSAIGVTSTNTDPASEEVDVYYRVRVYYKATQSDRNYQVITQSEYGADVVDAEGYLIDPTVFTPLNDGYYTFQYEIRDFYKNTATSSIGFYEFTNVEDQQAPTPIIYDASVELDKGEEIKNETYKLASRSVPNSVVVYAIGIDDNVSTAEDAELVRRIMTDDTTVRLTINDYDEWNLVFNYASTTSSAAYENLLANNYLIRKQAGSIGSDAAMLEWLHGHGYLIAVDNKNYASIYEMFGSTLNFGEGVTISSADEMLNWLKNATEEQISGLGLAYFDVDSTFGSTGTDGMGSGQYYIHYIARDAAGNESDVSRPMYIGSFQDNDKPELRFPTTLADSYLPTATITFDAPTASDTYDSNMLIKTMYRYLDSSKNYIEVDDEDGYPKTTENLQDLWTDLGNATANDQLNLRTTYEDFYTQNGTGYIDLTDVDASTYTIDLSEVADSERVAVKLQIITYVYDDKGNINVYGETINILNTNDNTPPAFSLIESSGEMFVSEYEQGDEIELPTLTVKDDAVSFMDFEVNVYLINGETKTSVYSYDSYAERKILNSTGGGTYTVYGGKFTAAWAGNYEASIVAKDSRNKTVVAFANYTVTGKTIIQPPVISTSLTSQTIELDGDSNYDPKVGIELPTPSVSYQIANSVTYDKYVANPDDYEDVGYVVMGVNENGRATNYSTSFGQQGSFKPTKTGEYDLYYTVNMTVYNKDMFTYQEMGDYNPVTGEYEDGGFFVFTNSNNSTNMNVTINNDGGFSIVGSGLAGSYTLRQTDGSAELLDSSNTPVDDLNNTTLFNGMSIEDLATWFDELREYVLTSDVYTIIVNDNVGPTIAAYEYPENISTENEDGSNSTITIYAIQGSDASGLNIADSRVVLSWNLANGDSSSQTFNGLNEDRDYTLRTSNGNILDGTYTVTYTVYDNNGNSSTSTYTIAVGDNIKPTLTFPDDFMEDSYTVGSQLRIDTSKITASDVGSGIPAGEQFVLTLTNTSTNKEIEWKENDGVIYVADLDEVGSYRLTIEIKDAVGNVSDADPFDFEVTARSTDPTRTYQIIGTILIVISVLVLVGVIIYFIVSKVKLDKELKK